MLPTVCTNNRLDSDLVAGRVRLGTRYSCLQKGIGTALHLPVDLKYLGPYEPIDDRRIYCGNNDVLPDGYDRFVNLPQCLQKGIGIGKMQKAQNYVPNKYKFMIFIYKPITDKFVWNPNINNPLLFFCN